MKTITTYMQEDHDRLDHLFLQFKETHKKDLEQAKKYFHEFKIGLQKHIVWEEEILFPIFEQKTSMVETGPTAVMKMEHRQIKDFLEKIHHSIAESLIQGLDTLESDLLDVLKSHNEKEEHILYPWIDNAVSESERKDVFLKMESLPPEKYNKCCR